MSLWYDCGSGLVKTTLAKANFGMDVYLFSSGPSLRDIDLNIFDGAPVYKVGINTTYPRVKPDMWVGLDYPKCFNKNLWTEPFIKVSRKCYAHHVVGSRPVTSFPLTYFANTEGVPKEESGLWRPWREIFLRRAHDTTFVWTNNTFTSTLHILIWMGVKRIHLIGSDFGGDSDYHDDSVSSRPFNHDEDASSGPISDAQRKKNKRLYSQQTKFLKKFSQEAFARGVEIISCTKCSPANVFLAYKDPAIALQESIERSKF